MTSEQHQARMLILARRQNNKCPIALMAGRAAMAEELHHTHLHNTKPNRKRYPMLIDSLWNLTAVSHRAHMERPSWAPWPRWSLLECDRREAFLARHPMICKALNP